MARAQEQYMIDRNQPMPLRGLILIEQPGGGLVEWDIKSSGSVRKHYQYSGGTHTMTFNKDGDLVDIQMTPLG